MPIIDRDTQRIEYCVRCGDPTGHAGEHEDSLFTNDGEGPFCDECFETLRIESGVLSGDEIFDIVAGGFFRETGMFAPGKSAPAAFNDTTPIEKRMDAWKKYNHDFRSLIIEIKRLGEF